MASVHYLDFVLMEHDFAYIACQLDDIDPRRHAHTRMSVYQGSSAKNWYFHDIKMNAISVTAARYDGKRYQITLSKEGEVEWFHNGGGGIIRTEKIPEAGVRSGTKGFMNHLRQIGDTLYACGQNGQVYKRYGLNDWRSFDDGVYKPVSYDSKDLVAMAKAISDRRFLNCIDGSSASDIYVVGFNGYMAHYNGAKWTQVKLNTDEHLQWVRCYSADEVWVCGYNGTLLVGNARAGFKEVSGVEDNVTWWCLAKYQGNIYLSAGSGLYAYDNSTKKIQRIKTGLKPDCKDSYRVDAVDGALWSVGAKDIVRLHNGKWDRIHDVDNERIGK